MISKCYVLNDCCYVVLGNTSRNINIRIESISIENLIKGEQFPF